MDAQKLFGKRIKELRKQSNYTQEQLSEILGVFQKQIGNIETGTTFTTMNNLEKMSQIFGVEIQDLFNFSHLKNNEEIIKEINTLINQASDDKLRIIYKVIKDIVK